MSKLLRKDEAGPDGNGQDYLAETPGKTSKPTPSWFPRTNLTAEQSDEFAVRYRQHLAEYQKQRQQRMKAMAEYHRLMTEETNAAGEHSPVIQTLRSDVEPRPAEAAARRPVMPRGHVDGQDRLYGNVRADERPEKSRTHRNRRGMGLGSQLIVAAFAAAAAGGTFGFAATKIDSIRAGAEAAKSRIVALWNSATPGAAPAADAAAPASTAIGKKPVATATLDVGDVTGTLNSAIPLMLRAEPAVADQQILLRLSGLPESAYLTAGRRAGEGSWQLEAGEEFDVKLVVPVTDTPKFDVSVAAIEKDTGELAAPVKEMRVAISDSDLKILPASAAPENVTVQPAAGLVEPVQAEPQPQEAPVQLAAAEPSANALDLVKKGDMLLQSGDLATARTFYEQAYSQGAAAAGAIGAGKTYDPAVYAELNVQGLAPDAGKAMEWYIKAQTSGSAEAQTLIDRLTSVMQ